MKKFGSLEIDKRIEVLVSYHYVAKKGICPWSVALNISGKLTRVMGRLGKRSEIRLTEKEAFGLVERLKEVLDIIKVQKAKVKVEIT